MLSQRGGGDDPTAPLPTGRLPHRLASRQRACYNACQRQEGARQQRSWPAGRAGQRHPTQCAAIPPRLPTLTSKRRVPATARWRHGWPAVLTALPSSSRDASQARTRRAAQRQPFTACPARRGPAAQAPSPRRCRQWGPPVVAGLHGGHRQGAVDGVHATRRGGEAVKSVASSVRPGAPSHANPCLPPHLLGRAERLVAGRAGRHARRGVWVAEARLGGMR